MKRLLTIFCGLLFAANILATDVYVTISFQGNGCRYHWEVYQTWQHLNGYCNGGQTNHLFWSGYDYGTTTNGHSTTALIFSSPAGCKIYPVDDVFKASYTASFYQWDGSQYVLTQQSAEMGDNGGGSYAVNFDACSTNAPTPPAPGPPPPCENCETCSGMPRWGVTEPYITFWLKDEPLGYQPASGPRVALDLGYKQHEDVTGQNPSKFSVGRKWNFPWFSFVIQDVYGNNVVHFPNGRQITFQGTNDYLTNTRLTGDTTNGFSLAYQDGSKDVYGFVVTNGGGGFVRAFLSERWNAQSQKTKLNYYSYTPGGDPVIRLQNVVDGDGRTNSIYYVSTNSYSTNLISQVVDAFGRTNSYAYDTNGFLTNITDVVGISSSFSYDANGWVTNLTTPYGTTSFQITDATDAAPIGRSVLVTEPNGAKQLYLYTNSAALPVSYATNDVPVTSPFTNTFDNADLNLRNSFHWDARQYAALSTTNISGFTSNDFFKARMQHWLKATTNSMGPTLSLTREPSPDSAGTTEGQKTWYDHAGKTNSAYQGTQILPLFVARVLPDGTTSFARTERNDWGAVTSQVDTYTKPDGTVGQRTNTFTYASNNIDVLTHISADGTQVSSNYFNANHQVLTNLNALNEMTIYTYDSSNRVTSIKRPSGLTTTNLYNSDGTLAKTIDLEINRTNSFTYANGLVYSQTDERGLTITNTWDNLQRLIKVTYPDGTFITNIYNNLDLVRVVDRMGFTNSFGYDSMRRKTAETNALGNYTLYSYCTCGSLDSVRDAAGNYTYFYYDNIGRQSATVYPDGYAVTNRYNLIGQVTNVIDSAGVSVTNWFNNQGLQFSVSNAFGQTTKLSLDLEDRATNSIDANGVSIDTTYDALGRTLTRTYPDGGVEKFGYTTNGLVAYTNQLNQVTRYVYDVAGRKTYETNANSEVTQFAYNAAGDRLALTDGKSQTTTWTYDIYGRMSNKVDAASNILFVYSYDPGNRLTNRWSIAKGNTVYKYDAVGSLTNIDYNVSPDITLQYDALNRLTNMVDAVGTSVYTYNTIGQLLSEDGPWANDTVSYSYDSGRRRSGLTILAPNASAWTQSYGYDSANRMTNITSPAGAFGYTLGGTSSASSLIKRLTLPNGAYITNTFDSVARLTGTYLKNSGNSVLNSHEYLNNSGNQRTKQTFTASNYVDYTYDGIGQLKTAFGKESGGTTNRLQEQLGYAYDAAHNLNCRTNNALVQAFNVNNLNELTTATNSGTLTVAGTTTSAATNVTVNSQTATLYLDNTFAKAGFTVTNGNNTYTAIAQDTYNRKDTNSITVNLPATNSYTYDLNGNLLSDGKRGLEYDDENQLMRVTVTNAFKKEYLYDGKMRLRVRKEFTWQGGAWAQTNEIHFVWDLDVVIQERDANNLPRLTLTRGLDLSGSLQGAGGIGGLLAMTENSVLNPEHSYYHADGNGNVTMLINTNQFQVGKYLYDPFGNPLSASGTKTFVNPIWFSSQIYDWDTGFLHYKFRIYIPELHRWLNRDPIAENGGVNLYAFLLNSPTSFIDLFGFGTWEIYNDDLDLNRPGINPRAKEPAGFSVVYKPDDGECSEGKIILYQIVSQKSLFGQSPTVDAPTDPYGRHPKGVKCPLPPQMTPDKPGVPNSYQDSPEGGGYVFEFTAVAICRDKCKELKLLSTFYFEFDSKTRKIIKRDPKYKKHFKKGMEQWWEGDKSIKNYYPNGICW
ncbi:MAG: RHS repeat-associated core domain-containing protein [Verrucomicrobia bacterium]|nr:RHS repeat-associated core domain-containing protein [Verrucomicrobiota bacterium]